MDNDDVRLKSLSPQSRERVEELLGSVGMDVEGASERMGARHIRHLEAVFYQPNAVQRSCNLRTRADDRVSTPSQRPGDMSKLSWKILMYEKISHIASLPARLFRLFFHSVRT